MKRFSTLVMIAAVAIISFGSCRSSRNTNTGGILGGSGTTGTIVKTVATIVGVILLSKLIKSVLGTVTGSSAFSNLGQNPGFASNFNEDTKLNSFATNDVLKGALQLLVSQKFEIPFTTVASNYNSLNTVGDLATFIGKNASAKVLNQIK